MQRLRSSETNGGERFIELVDPIGGSSVETNEAKNTKALHRFASGESNTHDATL